VSGIIGIFQRDGAPVPMQQLQVMTDFMAYRGPDGRNTWVGNEIGLGHATLRTYRAPSNLEPMQLRLLSITADVRLDSKSDLIKKLETVGQRIEANPSDAMLLLHAYTAWGPECVDHLRGDYAFGIWDAAAKTLFCARDHFGIKPFFYADVGTLFVFGNTLNCLRLHPAVTNRLNESAVGDFLLFGLNWNKATTIFQDIQRLPPAHSLLVSTDTLQIRRYWYPPTHEQIRYVRTEDYAKRFTELFEAAVVDRLPPGSVSILLSGGLDSGAVAAVASEFSKSRGGCPDVRSYTVGFDSLIPDNEGFYGRKMADHLGIPNDYVTLGNIELFEKWEDPEYRPPEPSENPMYAGLFEQFRTVALHSRVALSGEGADNLMYFQMWPYIKNLGRTQQWSRLIAETAWFLWIRPFPWLGIARRIQWFFKKTRGAGFPTWVDPDFAKRVCLEPRWRECTSPALPQEQHLSHPKGHASMLFPHWTYLFESGDPGVTHFPVEVRYPFLDLRIVHYLLAIPAFPWAYKKRLLRESMKKSLPEDLRIRPKTPLSVDPVLAKIRDQGKQWISKTPLSARVRQFVSPSRSESFCDTIDVGKFRAYCLDMWLKTVE
jgi:asparagine synthase (glutamine-hydrolysing)